MPRCSRKSQASKKKMAERNAIASPDLTVPTSPDLTEVISNYLYNPCNSVAVIKAIFPRYSATMLRAHPEC